jgi:NADH:ubiquinone oxidoreductase subunit H
VAGARHDGEERRLQRALAALALAGVAAAYWASLQPSIYPPGRSTFWGASPAFFGLRLGLVVLLLISALTAVFFLGGWLSPFDGFIEVSDIPASIAGIPVIGWLAKVVIGDGFQWLFIKIFFFLFCFLWFRATFPRYRYDQIMRLGWKVFLPLTIAYIVVLGAWMQTPLWIWWK